VLSFPPLTKIRVVSHYDADGITAAAIICKALYRAGYDFHASLMRNPFDKGLERVKKEANELIIFLDMGSGQIETIEQFDSKIIIIDHHQYLKKDVADHVLQINANLCGMNGNYEASGSSLSFAVAMALNPKNAELSPLALAGVTGDKQYIGGIRGYNKTLLDEALKNGYLTQKTSIKLSGDTLADALYYAVDPYYSGLSGDKKGIEKLMKNLNLEKTVKIEELNDDQKRQLHSILMFSLIKKGCQQNILDTVIRERYYSEMVHGELERFADLLDACGKGGNRGLGLATCLGDKDSFNEALSLEKEYKQTILDELLRLEKEGFEEKKSFRYFYSNDSSLGGVIGGIATNYLLDSEKPLLSLVRNDDELHVSCRGNQGLVKNGLDLGGAMKEVATELKGHGGGHQIAAGATIDIKKEEKFLDKVDSIISKQLKV
jgi:RecJ-like exonuclease